MTKRSRIVPLALQFSTAALLATGCSQLTGETGPDGGGGGGGGAAAIDLPGHGERVTGIYCSAPGACAIATDGSPGHLYATDGSSVTATIITADSTFAEPFGTLGDIGFSGFAKLGDRVMALVHGAASANVSATGDITKPASWTATPIGTTTSPSGDGFGLNQQDAIANAGSDWVFVIHDIVLTSSAAPAPSTVWAWSWSPQASPPVPANLEDLRAADATVCDSDPGVNSSPPLVQSVYVAPDLSVIVAPAGAQNQDGDDAPGVCISTDHGKTFHHAAFPGAGLGPMGIACTSKDHCVAYGDVPFGEDPSAPIVFVSNDASKGAGSTWTAAKTPAVVVNTMTRNAVFASDGQHGWLLGWHDGATAFLFATTDGGATWTDDTSALGAPDGFRPYTALVADDHHLWIGGEWVGDTDKVLVVAR